MSTMKGCVKVDQAKVMMADLPVPKAGPGEIVVRTTLATICGSDMHMLDERPLDPAFVPPGLPGMPMGHEAVGVVHEVGPGVQNFKVGDRVIPSCLTACGRCPQCLEGQLSACTGGGGILRGCQSEYFTVPFADVSAAKIPDALSDEQVLLATDIMSTGFGAIERAEVKFGDTVAIFAQGPVGLCCTVGARARGAGRIIAVESVPDRIKASQAMGANIVINPQEKDPVQEIMALTDGKGVDVAVEAVGLQATFEAATRVVRRGGTVSVVGVFGAVPGITLPTGVPSFLHRKVVFTLCPVGHDRMAHLLNLIQYGSVDLRPLLSHRMKLSQAPEAYDLFRSRTGGVLKVALTP